MGILLIDEGVRSRVREAHASALAHPVPRAWIEANAAAAAGKVDLADRPEGFSRPRARVVQLGSGLRANLSVEDQPAGLVRHLSISTDGPGLLPSQAVTAIVMGLFGFPPPPDQACRYWLEEFEPGHRAINAIGLESDLAPVAPAVSKAAQPA